MSSLAIESLVRTRDRHTASYSIFEKDEALELHAPILLVYIFRVLKTLVKNAHSLLILAILEPSTVPLYDHYRLIPLLMTQKPPFMLIAIAIGSCVQPIISHGVSKYLEGISRSLEDLCMTLAVFNTAWH